MKTYKIDAITFKGCKIYCGREYGNITVGGDRADVKIDNAIEDGEDVICTGVTVQSHDDLTEEEAENLVREVVEFCYASIDGETFIGRDCY